ncbi:hypothetical protein L2E82_33532 [Cichorium intybus]|uniref:Uncharacterized protein n=1 Tax=Cichorium intybus TaxID=13427 RepID=A0ACB9BKF1_CICIN|nr:hypothetical protein L2E82_33532 [Cichorium intybus]
MDCFAVFQNLKRSESELQIIKQKAFSCFLRRLIFRIRLWIELTAGLLKWMLPTIMMHHRSSLKVAYLQRLLLMVIQFQILKAQ